MNFLNHRGTEVTERDRIRQSARHVRLPLKLCVFRNFSVPSVSQWFNLSDHLP